MPTRIATHSPPRSAPSSAAGPKLPTSISGPRGRLERAIGLARLAISEGSPTPARGPLRDRKLQGDQLESVRLVLQGLERAYALLGGDPAKVAPAKGTYSTAGWGPGTPASSDTAPIRQELFGAARELSRLLGAQLRGKPGERVVLEALTALSRAHSQLTL